MNMATRVLAREVHHLGMRAIVVEPGYIATDILANVQKDFVEKQKTLARSPEGRVYPGFLRYLEKEFPEDSSRKPARGVHVSVMDSAILGAVQQRFPSPTIRAGGLEVISANWIPLIIPDIFQDYVADAIAFRYGQSGESKFARMIGGT